MKEDKKMKQAEEVLKHQISSNFSVTENENYFEMGYYCGFWKGALIFFIVGLILGIIISKI